MASWIENWLTRVRAQRQVPTWTGEANTAQTGTRVITETINEAPVQLTLQMPTQPIMQPAAQPIMQPAAQLIMQPAAQPARRNPQPKIHRARKRMTSLVDQRKRKRIRGTQDCPICSRTMFGFHAPTRCCHQYLHAKCLKKWKRQKMRQHRPPQCPLCRQYM